MSQPKALLSDTHCHLILPHFVSDRREVIECASEIGVRRILVPGIDLETSRQAVELSERVDLIYAAVGIHPHQASEWRQESLQEISVLAQAPKAVAIGEIGLDYFRNFSSQDEQLIALREQLKLAGELGLPVILHNRDAITPLLEELEWWVKEQPSTQPTPNGVLHAYSSDITHAEQAIELGFYLGIAGPITYKNAHERRAITKQLPLDRLLIETDSPYMPPHPHRGQRNEPKYVELIAKQLSKTLDLDLQSIMRATFENANRLFGWSYDD